jgi:hypothetical protein
MAVLTGELVRLLSGEILAKEERRSLTNTVVARWIIMISVAIAVYTASYPINVPDEERAILVACVIAIVSAHLSLTFRGVDYRIRGNVILIGVAIAALVSEPNIDHIFFGRSSVLLVIPVIMAPILVRPRCAFVWWALLQAGAVVYAIYVGRSYPFYIGAISFTIATVSWLSIARADRVIDLLVIQKQDAEDACIEAETAIDVIVSAEADSVHRSNTWLKEIAGRLKT